MLLLRLQMRERTRPGARTSRSPAIVVSTEGAKQPEVVAIVLLAGVERILAAQPKGSSNVVWDRGT